MKDSIFDTIKLMPDNIVELSYDVFEGDEYVLNWVVDRGIEEGWVWRFYGDHIEVRKD